MADLSPIETARFWSRVSASTPFQCWPWTGRKNDRGYGRWGATMAHRVAYALVHGSIPDGAVVRHRCDNPECCNPDHLLIGTNAQNTADALERGRLARGGRHGNSRLTPEQVEIIRRNPDGLKQVELARQFGVSAATISYIRSGRSWR